MFYIKKITVRGFRKTVMLTYFLFFYNIYLNRETKYQNNSDNNRKLSLVTYIVRQSDKVFRDITYYK